MQNHNAERRMMNEELRKPSPWSFFFILRSAFCVLHSRFSFPVARLALKEGCRPEERALLEMWGKRRQPLPPGKARTPTNAREHSTGNAESECRRQDDE